MSILKIIKLESGAFLHNDSVDGDFFLGKFYFKQEFNKAFIVETYGAKRRTYLVTEIKVLDFGGTEESFTNWNTLFNRLTTLGYNGIETNGLIPANIETTANKTDVVAGNETSIFKYLNVKGVVDYVVGFFVPKTRTLTIGGVTQDLSADRTFTVGGTAKRSYYAEWKFNGIGAASANWYAQGQLDSLRGTFVATAGITPTNNFANYLIQTPCFILPFQAKIKSFNAKGFSNGGNANTLRMVVNSAFTPSGGQTTIQNPLNVADVSFVLNQPNANSFTFQSNSTGLSTTTLQRGTEIRLFFFNNNLQTALQSTIISIEFEEVL